MLPYTLLIALFLAAIFAGMVSLLEIGRWLARRRQGDLAEKVNTGSAAVVGAIFGLLGLLIAFTFSSAVSHYEACRQLILDESVAIESAWEQIAMLPPDMQPGVRDALRAFIDSQQTCARKFPDIAAVRAEMERCKVLQHDLWQKLVAAQADTRSQSVAQELVIPAFSHVIDIWAQRCRTATTHQPPTILIMLTIMALVSALMAGYSMGSNRARSWIHDVGFALVVTITVYVILELETPRLGFIRLDAADRWLDEARQEMK